jgi:hypothetical protein
MMVRKRDTGDVFAMKVIRKEYMLGTMCDGFVLLWALVSCFVAFQRKTKFPIFEVSDNCWN